MEFPAVLRVFLNGGNSENRDSEGKDSEGRETPTLGLSPRQRFQIKPGVPNSGIPKARIPKARDSENGQIHGPLISDTPWAPSEDCEPSDPLHRAHTKGVMQPHAS